MATNNSSDIGSTSQTTLGTIITGNWTASTVTVPYGGSGTTSHTAWEVLCGGTTSTSPVQSVVAGSAGEVLTHNGAGALPSWQAAGAGGGADLVHAVVTITPAEFKSIYTTPKLIVSAPGANKFLFVMELWFEVDYGGTAFVYAGGAPGASAPVGLQYGSLFGGLGYPAGPRYVAQVFTVAYDAVIYNNSADGTIIQGTYATDTINVGLYLSTTVGNFTTGNSTLYCHVIYQLADTVI